MRHEYLTEGIVRCPDRMAEVSRGRSSRASGEGPNDRKAQQCLGLDEGIALAIPLRRASVGRERVKPAMDANARSEAHTASPNHERPARSRSVNGSNLSNRRMRTRMYGGVGGEGPRGLTLSRFCSGLEDLPRVVVVTLAAANAMMRVPVGVQPCVGFAVRNSRCRRGFVRTCQAKNR